MVVLDAHSKNSNKGSFWSFYPENILQSFSPFKEVEYLESIVLWFQIVKKTIFIRVERSL